MPATPPDFFGNLDSTRPRGDESRTLSDDYQRNMRESCRIQAPNWTGAITATHSDLNVCIGLAVIGGKIMTGDGGTTVAAFANPSAPAGWTIESGFDGRMLVTAGTINGSTVAGGDIGGTNDPGINDTVPAHTHTDDLSFTTQSAGSHAHSIPYASAASTTLQNGARWYGPSNIASNNASVGSRSGFLDSAGSHTHGMTKSGSVQTNTPAADWVPLYAVTIFCKLDA